ncbi:hypothetical protein [Altererythrobacter sp. GH1-8]|uniref:hypothetical protein n=1 Tax=Altererythrobacter sp. GH1-8 TaxID=3349333 RepID=UPI00374DBB92
MKTFSAIIGLAAASLSAVALAQSNDAPLPVASANAQAPAVLPANTEVLLRMNQEVTTKGKTWAEGDTFDMTVVHDVRHGDYVVIPRGSRGVGRITWLTNKGAFGKSGKMDIELEYVEVAGRRIDINGTYRQEGEGNTLATVGGVVLAGVFAGFITGKSGRIPRGRELMATTENDIALALPQSAAPASAPQPAPQYVAPAQNAVQPSTVPVQAVPVVAQPVVQPTQTPAASEPVTSDRLKKKSPIQCVTC